MGGYWGVYCFGGLGFLMKFPRIQGEILYDEAVILGLTLNPSERCYKKP